MLIGELSSKTKVSIHSIRYYEKTGFFKSDQRRNNNYREYSSDLIPLILFIKSVQKLGFSLTEIKEVLDLFRKRSNTREELVEKKLNNKIFEIENKIKELNEIRKLLHKVNEICKKNTNRDKDLKYLLESLNHLKK